MQLRLLSEYLLDASFCPIVCTALINEMHENIFIGKLPIVEPFIQLFSIIIPSVFAQVMVN